MVVFGSPSLVVAFQSPILSLLFVVCINAGYAVMRCLSVCLSVTFVDYV